MHLTNEQIKHIANLARLNLTDKELEIYGEQLSKILNYIEQLKEVNTEGVEPTAQITGLENIFRKDAVQNWDEQELGVAFDQAPIKQDDQYKVKRIL